MFSHRDPIAIAHVEHPGKPAGVEHTANEGLNQTGFTRPGRPADCHVEIGIVHSRRTGR